MKFFCLSILLIIGLAAYGQDQYSYTGFESPVSVAEYGGYLYLSNAGKSQDLTAKDKDGYISRIKSDGSEEEAEMKFITGLDSPRGIAVVKGTLYVCDIDCLLGFNLQTKRKVFELSFSSAKTQQLTDIASENDLLYVSATDINTIFEVNIEKSKYSKWLSTPYPTGIFINKGQMYICSWGSDDEAGHLGVVDMKNKKYKPLPGCEGKLWGVVLDGKKLYFSDWVNSGKQGVIKWIDLDTQATGQVQMTSKIAGPADFVYDSRNDFFMIPAMLEGRVYGAIGFVKKK